MTGFFFRRSISRAGCGKAHNLLKISVTSDTLSPCHYKISVSSESLSLALSKEQDLDFQEQQKYQVITESS